ncbi:squalene/phytoene synthase family protein [Streptomyces roseirectus]|uniref:Squalene/phytoene synthase family protein n=1 Tax=Streptomyces roseirectus TaxID=2768066 RepID=A0A7H0IPU6_9ACTN|nr:squalene/phytoene synthase family protein [Streptomyces roseirectus]QNP74812.1 squalene/phytoene synthase family protein [Streptomyces roseirectus]
MLVRRWLDAAGITDPVLRHCYMVCAREASGLDGGRAGWAALRITPAAARPHVAALTAHGYRADACADTGPAEDRRRRLAEFTEATWAAFGAEGSHDPVLHATAHTYRTLGMPLSLIEDMFTGMRRDVDFRDFATYAELCRWSVQVGAGTFYGVMWAMAGTELSEVRPLVREFTELCQLADVLCDLSQDLDDGRLYLPLEDLDRFGVRPEDVKAKRWTPPMADLVAFEAARVTDRLPALAAELDRTPVGPFTRAVSKHFMLLAAGVPAAGQDVLHRPVQPPLGHFLDVWRPVMHAVIPC